MDSDRKVAEQLEVLCGQRIGNFVVIRSSNLLHNFGDSGVLLVGGGEKAKEGTI